MNPVDSALLQFGAVGVIATLALAAVKVMFARVEAAHQRESARADRLETELRELNDLIRDRYTATLTDATKAIADALAMVRSKL